MRKIMISPAKYVQGANELANLGEYVAAFGKKALLISSKDDQARVQGALDAAQKKESFTIESGGFNLECSWAEIKLLEAFAKDKNADVIIGLGGGKSLDTAKAVANQLKKPVIIIPTIASTDAPCSALAVIYTEKGEFDEYFFFNQNPNLVLVDTAIIAKAPVRFLIAGMGDALATWFESRACIKSFAQNASKGHATLASQAISKKCFDVLMEDSLKAIAACESGVPTIALENIVEANILLSGLGFESCGLAACHAIHNGLTVLDETHHLYHGEKVAFGVIVQLVLENAPMDELDMIIDYCQMVGLPTCLADLGVEELTKDRLMKVAEGACAPGETIHNMPFAVTPDMVAAAILAADKLGGRYGDEA